MKTQAAETQETSATPTNPTAFTPPHSAETATPPSATPPQPSVAATAPPPSPLSPSASTPHSTSATATPPPSASSASAVSADSTASAVRNTGETPVPLPAAATSTAPPPSPPPPPASTPPVSAEMEARAKAIVAKYLDARSATLPLLHLIMEEHGWISPEWMRWVARLTKSEPIDVLGVVTFYPMFRQTPQGRRQVRVCRTLSCALRGAEETMRALENELGCKRGEMSADGAVSLEYVECLACCASGPVVQVNRALHENVSPDAAASLAAAVRASLDTPAAASAFGNADSAFATAAAAATTAARNTGEPPVPLCAAVAFAAAAASAPVPGTPEWNG